MSPGYDRRYDVEHAGGSGDGGKFTAADAKRMAWDAMVKGECCLFEDGAKGTTTKKGDQETKACFVKTYVRPFQERATAFPYPPRTCQKGATSLQCSPHGALPSRRIVQRSDRATAAVHCPVAGTRIPSAIAAR